MAAWLDVCRFSPTAGGTADWTYSAAAVGYQSPTAAGVVNGTIYRYRAESSDLTQWEVGYGAYNTGTGVLARTTVLYNSAGTGTGAGQTGTGSKINFTAVPQVAIVALAEDLVADINEAWTAYTPTVGALAGTVTTASAAGRYKQIGKTVHFSVGVTLTNPGTASSALTVTLPVTASASAQAVFVGREDALSAAGLVSQLTGTTVMFFQRYDGAFIGTAGMHFVLSGTYEAA